MSALLYGLDTGVEMNIDLSSTTVDASFIDISEVVVGSNIVIGMDNTMFTSLLDISTGGGTGTVTISENYLKTVIANVIDGTGTDTYYKVLSGTITGLPTIGTAGDASTNQIYNFGHLTSYITDYFRNGTENAIIANVAAKTVGLSSAADFGPTDASDELITALTNAGVFTVFTSSMSSGCGFLGRDVSAIDYVSDASFFGFTDASTPEKQRLFNSLADAGYLLDDAMGISGVTGVSFENNFALGMSVTLKGGITATLEYAADISFVDTDTGNIVDASGNLSGELSGISVSETRTVADSTNITNHIYPITLVSNTSDPYSDQIRFNLLFVKVA